MSSEPALTFRSLERRDFAQLAIWLSRPHVSRWWNQAHDMAAIESHYGPRIDGTDPTRMFVIELDRRAIGFIQSYHWRDYPEHAHRLGAGATTAGLDLAIGEADVLGRGLGTQILAQFVDTVVFADPDVTACIADPDEHNDRSARAFAAAGFVTLRAIVDDDGTRRLVVCLSRRYTT